MVGTHIVTVGGVDISCLVDEVSIMHGRDDPTSQPDASAATVDFTATTDDPLPPEADVGATVVVTTTTPTGTSTRFVGRVTDLTLGWDDAAEDTPDNGVGQLVAVGPIADLGRRVVGDVPFPTELDGARVARVLAAAGKPLNPATSDPGTVQILARDIDATAALNAARDAAVDASGIVWETRAGEVRYADADHRRGIPTALVLDSCDVLVTPSWRRNIEGLVNEVSIAYGLAPEGGEQPTYAATAAASVDRWGRYGYSSTTALAALGDAQAMGNLLLARNSAPVWVMAALPVDVAGLDATRYDALLGLDVHSLVSLTGLPAIGAAPTAANLWVEGYRETLGFGVHDVELVVSGYCRTVPPPRWDDVDPGWTWGTSTITETRRNLAENPVGPTATEVGWWIWVRGSSSLGADGAGVRLTITDATAAVLAQRIETPTPTIVAAPGETVSVSAELRTNTASSGSCSITFQDSGGATLLAVTAPPVALGSTTYKSVSATLGPAPAGTVRAMVRFGLHTGARAVGEWLEMRRAIIERAPAPGAWFDGDTTAAPGLAYAWTGGPRASESTESTVADTGGGLPPNLTWDDATCLGPPIDIGRWNDQPASLRWDQIDPAVTWDTYA